MRILVTGGAGFIGSHVADAFLDAGHTVAVLDNFSTGRHENLSPAVTCYTGDLHDRHFVEQVFHQFAPDFVDHHAAQIDVRKSVDDPLVDAETNILGTLQLLDVAQRHGIKKFLYASSGGAVYGNPEYLPADERHPINPLCPYGISKHTVEHYLQVFSMMMQLNFTVLRYANVYGPRQNVHGEAGVIAIFIGKMLTGETPVIYGDGKAVRDYVYVGDVARANVLALTRGDRQCINISTGVGTSVNELYGLLAEELHFSTPPTYASARPGEIASTYLDHTLAKHSLGWVPAVTLRQGVVRTIRQAHESDDICIKI